MKSGLKDVPKKRAGVIQPNWIRQYPMFAGEKAHTALTLICPSPVPMLSSGTVCSSLCIIKADQGDCSGG